MTALVRKEIRLLLPSWLAAMALAVVPVWLVHPGPPHDLVFSSPGLLVFGGFGLGVLILSLTPFGQEFNAGTFNQLLSQPLPRNRLWLAKTGVLAAGLISALVALSLSYALYAGESASRPLLPGLLLSGGTIALVACGSGLWTSLLLRQVTSAFWVALVVPLGIGVATARVSELYQEAPVAAWAVAALVVYAVAGYLWGHRLFLRAQDTQWTGGTIRLPAWRNAKARASFRASGPGRTVLRSLIGKELQLHHISLLVAAAVFLLHVFVLVLRRLHDPGLTEASSVVYMILMGWMVLWFALPFLLGSLAVAEERKLGTLESLLCLPVDRRIQFAVKFGVALALSVLLCAIIPWLIESAGLSLGALGGPFDSAFDWRILVILTILAVVIAALSFYASTLARHALQAMGLAVVAMILTALLIAAATSVPAAGGIAPWGNPRLVVWIGIPTLSFAVLGLAYFNSRRLQIDRAVWRRNGLTLVVCLIGVFTLTATIYHRAWERFQTLEPAHGPARLSGPIRPRVCMGDPFLLALLPDGQLWAMNNYRLQRLYTYVSSSATNEVRAAIPLNGEFLSSSNWVTLAHRDRLVAGIQTDGTLWKFLLPGRTNATAIPRPERVGTDTDWQNVAAGAGFYLALKTNGTLWGWGNNHEGQLGTGPARFTNDLVRIGTNSDWAAVFATWQTSIGVKRDGSVWKWGSLVSGPNGWRGWWKPGAYPDPVRWGLDGSGWIARAGGPVSDLVLRQDGTLWVSGSLPRYLLGSSFSRRIDSHGESRFSSIPLPVGGSSRWADISGENGELQVAVSRNGQLFENKAYSGGIFGIGAVRKPSRHSDWIAGEVDWSDSFVALAADGTLCCWSDDPWNRGEGDWPLLGPTRKPLWSLNLFTATK
jgi:ABC-type transport system involved in multi-copper enzyme maturation permease subunit